MALEATRCWREVSWRSGRIVEKEVLQARSFEEWMAGEVRLKGESRTGTGRGSAGRGVWGAMDRWAMGDAGRGGSL